MNNQFKLRYKPEIDGLRALAVLGVIFYHVEIFLFDKKILTGGFLGVDIFFVISGYLITFLIIKEYLISEKLSLKNFYFRRAKRILPALFFMIFASIFFAWMYLTPENFLQYSNSIISSILFYSNYFFYFEGLEYNAESSLLKPLLHTWSLGVEEQFYIFFPIFFLLSYKILKNKLVINYAIILIFFFILANYLTYANSSLSFYSTFSRIWEILFGSLLAILEYKNKKINFKYQNIFPSFGLFLILLSFVFFNSSTLHPSYLTLIPIMGVFLIIHFINYNDIVYKLLTFGIISKIGVWSYSLYLWHFPIFAFARNRGKDLSEFDKIELLVLTFLLSIISFYLVEKPIRKIEFKQIKKFLFSLFCLIILFLGFSYLSIKNNGFEDRIHVFLKNSARENLWEATQDGKGICFDRNENFCNFGQSENQRILLIGDSHSEVLSYGIINNNLNKNYNIVSMNRGSCIYLPGVEMRTKIENKEYWNCTNKSKKLIDQIIADKEDSIIVLSGNFKKYFFSETEWNYISKDNLPVEGIFRNSIINLLKKNKVILVYPVPSLDYDLRKRMMNEVPKSTFKASEYLKESPYTTAHDKYIKDNKKIIEFFDNINGKNLYKIFPDKVFCNKSENKCYSHKGKKLYYDDSHHLSSNGAELLSNEVWELVKKIRNIKN